MKRAIAILALIVSACSQSAQEVACDNVEGLTAIREQRVAEIQPHDPITVLDEIAELDRDIAESRARCAGRDY